MHITTLVQCTSTSKKPAAVGDPFFLRRPGTDNKQMANGTGAENSGRNTGIEMGAELDASSERGEGGGPGSAPAAALAAALANTAGRSSSPPPSPHLIPPDCDADANAGSAGHPTTNHPNRGYFSQNHRRIRLDSAFLSFTITILLIINQRQSPKLNLRSQRNSITTSIFI